MKPYHAAARSGILKFSAQIRDLQRVGQLPAQFRASDLVIGLSGAFSETYIKTALPNWCESGNYPRRGLAAVFRRVDRGLYQLLDGPSSDHPKTAAI
jgi:hypothetical protein